MIKKIKNNFYHKHVGLIFKIENSSDFDITFEIDGLDYSICNSPTEIVDFYHQVGYSNMSIYKIINFLENNVRFFVIKKDGQIIAINGIFTKTVFPFGFSFYTLLKKNEKKLIVEQSSAYSGLLIVSPDYRGQRLYEKLVKYILHTLSFENIDNLFLTTGTRNKVMIRATQRMGGKLIGITDVTKFLKYFIIRRELFLDDKEKVWQCE